MTIAFDNLGSGRSAGVSGLLELLRPSKPAAMAALAQAAAPLEDGKPLIEMRNVSKTFGTVKALEDLQVEIKPGELVTVVGPSGCGKSTLFNILGGLEEPDPGNVLRFKG
ncbi:MAG: ATP-binding cassette domain-containing protein, partial [Oxalobacteraceae bacterium]